MTRVITYRDKKKSDIKQAWWSEKQKYEVVAAFVLLGNLAHVARMTGIPEITCRKWKASPWWAEAEDEIRRGAKVQLSGRLTKAIELANIALEDRLSNGDFIFDYKTGKMIRKPVTADTAVKVLDKLIDRQEQLDQAAKRLETTTREGVDERLKKLAEDFLKFANSKTITGELTNEVQGEVEAVPGEVEDVLAESSGVIEDAVVEELQEGLPAGEQVQVKPGADQAPGNAEQGPQGSLGEGAG